MELLCILRQIKKYILEPISIKLDNIKSNKLTFDDPILNKLRDIPDLGSYRRNAISSCYIIISIPTYFLFNYIISISSRQICREVGVLGHVLDDTQDARSSLFDVIGVSAVEWPHETISIRVEIDYKFKLVFVSI